MSPTCPAPSAWSLRPSDVALRVGVHPMTIRRWADDGVIPCWRTPGGGRRFRPADVDRLITLEARVPA